MQLPYPNF